MRYTKIDTYCSECGQSTGTVEIDNRYKIGEKVLVRSGFGRDPSETVEIEDLDTKNGLPLICYTDKNGDGRWAYFDQIIKKVS
jgi:hypothetical protein